MAHTPISAAVDDPVLSALGDAETAYRTVRDELDRRNAEAETLEGERDLAREAERTATAELVRLRDQMLREKMRAARLEERSRHLADALKTIHRSFFDGNVYKLILCACMTITGATRGLYLTAWKDNLRLRASFEIDGYPEAPPSDFLRALCKRAEEANDTIVVNGPEGREDLPAPKPGERFGNFLVAPAVIMHHFNGIVLLADKMDGDFDEEDVDTVLGIGKQAAVAVENRRLQDELLGAYFSVVGVLADAVEAKDPYTRGHCELVAHYARRTAEKLGLSEVERSIVCFGGLLHDIGKIGVSDGVLNKPGKLMPEEWDLMRSHVRIGRDLLARVPVLQRVADVVLHHHERYDGAGYPDGLGAEQISLASRIICVTDAYCAMISKRSYKESMSGDEARAELLRCRGSHFDPAVVDAFLATLDEPDTVDDGPDRGGVSASFYHPYELQYALEAPNRVESAEAPPELQPVESGSPTAKGPRRKRVKV
jgi:putative nucleotidyltransferase with HDIG domain